MTTADQPSESLLAAMTRARIPVENHEFIRRFTTAIGIAEYRAVPSDDKPHVVATRRDGLPDLRIYYGYTTGFGSAGEVVGAAGAAAEREPGSRRGTWFVKHPTSRVYDGSGRAQDKRREGSFCGCGMQLSLTGVCSNCD